jgi:hypothetical protein
MKSETYSNTGKKRSGLRIFILLLLVFVIFASLTLIVYFRFIFIKTENVPMDITVANKIGFNTDTDALHFGTVYPGGEARRTIVIRNSNDFPVSVDIGVFGDISGWVTVHDRLFTIGPMDNSSVDFTVDTPDGTEPGTYTGYSTFVMKRKFS